MREIANAINPFDSRDDQLSRMWWEIIGELVAKYKAGTLPREATRKLEGVLKDMATW